MTCGYLRQNIIEDVWADIFSVAQSTISRYLTLLTPLVEKATEEDRPTEEDAAEATRDAIALVDGTLWLMAATARGPKMTTGIGDAAFGYHIGLVVNDGGRCIDISGLTFAELQDDYTHDVAMAKIIITALG